MLKPVSRFAEVHRGRQHLLFFLENAVHIDVIPGDERRGSLLHQAEHRHVEPFVLVGSETVRECEPAVRRNHQAHPDWYKRVTLLLAGCPERILEQIDTL